MSTTGSSEHQKTPEYPSFEKVVEFHGHVCPGLATGYRVAVTAMQALGIERPKDEELVTIAETDACGVDAIQVVTGCTAGKGNLVIHDYGKHVFTFYCRRSNKAVRVSTPPAELIPRRPETGGLGQKVFSGTANAEEEEQNHTMMHEVTDAILRASPEEVVKVEYVAMEPPEKARIFTSVPCACCGEMVADAKARVLNGKMICIPCFLKKNQE